MSPEIGLIHVLPQEWDTVWLGRHRVATGLSRYFNSIWMEPPRHWREALPELTSSRFWKPALDLWPWLTVYRHGFLLGEAYRLPWLNDVAARKRLKDCRKRLVEDGCQKIVLMIWRPGFFRYPDLVPYDLCCYYINDEYSFDLEKEVSISPEEELLLRRSDLVFIHSTALLEAKGDVNPNTFRAPNGVDFQHFSSPCPEAEDLRAIPQPRIGYVGHLKNQLDWELIRKLVDRHPDWSFVFVGPVSPHPAMHETMESLSRRANAFFLGFRSKDDLPAYIQHFDVCTMPYIVAPYTNAIYPLKLHEYLATGRPVVSSPITTAKEFSGMIEIAAGTDEWSEALERSMNDEEQGSLRATERQRVAKEFDWGRLTEKVANRIRSALEDAPA